MIRLAGGRHQPGADLQITLTPRMVAIFANNSIPDEAVQAGRNAIISANDRIVQYALAHDVAIVDLFTMADVLIPHYPGTFGGQTYDTMFGSNGLDILTQPQGIISNAVATALNLGFGDNLPLFSDQEIVATSGFTPNGDTTYYDVRQFVIVPEPGLLALALPGGIALLACFSASRRRWWAGIVVRHRTTRHPQHS